MGDNPGDFERMIEKRVRVADLDVARLRDDVVGDGFVGSPEGPAVPEERESPCSRH